MSGLFLLVEIHPKETTLTLEHIQLAGRLAHIDLYIPAKGARGKKLHPFFFFLHLHVTRQIK